MSTVSGIEDLHGAGSRRRLVGRRVRQWAAVVVLAILVGVASRTHGTATAQGEGWSVRMEYAEVVRAGQPTPLEFTITSAANLTEPVHLGLCGSWFDAMDFQNWYPVPAAESRAGNTLDYEFDPTGETTMTIALDARSAPGQFGAILPCEVTVESPGRPTLTMSFTTLRLP